MEKIKMKYKSYVVTVYHKQGCNSKKLVFLHGGGLDSALLSWKEVIELMGSEYDIYAIDLLGYGESDKPDITYSIPMYVELLHDILQQLNIERTYLAGLSMGGGTSIGFSLKYPEMVDKLVLVDSLGLYERMPFHTICRWFVNSSLNSKSYQWFAKSKKLIKWSIGSSLIDNKEKITDALVSELYDLVQAPGCSKAWESFQRYELGKENLTSDLAPHLSELKMPVLIVNGEKDSLVPAKSAIAASRAIANCQLYIMKGCKHWAQKEKPDEFVNILKAFL
ncbi:alpha/beta fold hydrolase [Clostridium oryzae]|uniref:2-hydroxy-6-oxo-6-(2'-aminophenyl)hexa-2, 4-dienoic acid hydrolase n=1 Tax=Clostridium oryzae TaxID=1450648 RepID=A0A1V4IHV9_9CLOT|nr:alpha/beta hydrolase [Clostridium oryzae]OPJ59588.1 2-hydroxy-6-oxo-6-(2'-aminophenyl)hexa-2,4-dienoic acid hydrolase [Clostridium oryzae]